ncbi:E3 ubiquitin-protein ligase RSL1-like [Salvia miltiorrhiza]|uniref:E3 ubiquitin-protein ligase RSL1-like n=1 Tax=Salvia miltiorrhiza TaxID=226208 RepID=UPI0025AC0F44|nr:E3 ubiquitin-protein ligase RSL1-like [Salvia miltiorrhiza]
MEMIMSSIMAAFDEALSLTHDYAHADEAIQIQQALHASLSSSSQTLSCEICTEDKQASDMLDLDGCRHSFCAACISKHVQYKLRDNVTAVSCPAQGCRSAIQPAALRPHVAAEVLDRWEEAVAESSIEASQRVRCPYGGCSEVLVNEGGDAVAECECPWCHRLFCARCGVPWHQGRGCREFRRERGGKREKEGLRRLAEEKKWKKCPNCKVFVDKTEGCIHITCRCKLEFCYACGENWNESHWTTCQE